MKEEIQENLLRMIKIESGDSYLLDKDTLIETLSSEVFMKFNFSVIRISDEVWSVMFKEQ